MIMGMTSVGRTSCVTGFLSHTTFKVTVSPPNQPHTFLPTEMVVSNDNLRKDSSALTEPMDFTI